jgi:hypothetical protein
MRCGRELDWDEPHLLRLVQACDRARSRLRQLPAARDRDRLLERVEAVRAGAVEELALLRVSAEERSDAPAPLIARAG